MKYWQLITLSILVLSCGNPVTRTMYRNESPITHERKKVLVIGITPHLSSSKEKRVEEKAIHFLQRQGFDAVAYPDAYAMFDMAMISQDAVGFILEENNIDYVLTIANIDSAKALPVPLQNEFSYTATSWFYHIRKYRASPYPVVNANKGSMVWESFLFDAHSFDTRCIMRTAYRSRAGQEREINAVTKDLVKHLIKTKQFERKQRKGF